MMETTDGIPAGFELAGDDRVVPFHVPGLDVRGRAVQVGPLLDQVLRRHDYPPPVAALLGHALVLTVLIGASLKFDGKFILQAQGDGPVSLLVADFRTPGDVRGYARFDAEAVAAADPRAPYALLGEGVLALTIDQGPQTRRYQGIVQLKGESLEEAARQYFVQSEQIPTEVRIAVAQIMTPGADGRFASAWRAGGLLVQFLPEAPDRMRPRDLPGGDIPHGAEPAETGEDDSWVEARMLAATVAADELTDPSIGAERLLYRLFHEHGVHVFASQPVRDQCSCSRERVAAIVRSLPPDELAEALQDGGVTTTCEFCSTSYTLDAAELAD
jgi:molecular chaperone Hsp33